MKYLAVDIGGTYTKYAVMNENGDFFRKGKRPTEKESQEAFLEMLIQLFHTVSQQESEPLQGLAISSAGVIDSKAGFMKNAGTLFCVKDLFIGQLLGETLQIPVTVENDARCAALAELWKGSLQECSDAVVMIIGTALGGTVIHDKKIRTGKSGLVGEFSYLLTDSEHPDDPNKTAAMSCGVPALLKMAAQVKRVPAETLTGEQVFAWALAQDAQIINVIHRYARRLSVQILNSQFTIGPEKVALGGGISEQPLLLSCIKEELKKLVEVYPYSVSVPEVVNCRFYNEANLIGALYVLLDTHMCTSAAGS